MKGRVLFFDTTKGFGQIECKVDEPQSIFVHFSQIRSDAKILLQNEEVEFETQTTPKGISAINVNRTIDRRIGTVESFDNGFGFIRENSNDNKLFFHHSSLRDQPGYTNIESGLEVEFTPGISSQGAQAENVILRDRRTALQKFASFADWQNAIQDLATNLTQFEEGNWDYLKKKTGAFPVLENYITHTFARLLKEEKIQYALTMKNGNEVKLACFNTGLATSKQEEIFAYFEEAKKTKITSYLKQPMWVFKCFDRESNRIMTHFAEKPKLANYFDRASELIYDTRRRLIQDYEHILDDRGSRFPKEFASLSKEQQVERLKSAIESALIRIRRNYKTAIPQFYNNAIQLLLPLCINSVENADIALVVAKEGEVYRANTVLPLDWAYNNARLLAKPDREWLNP